MGNAVVFTGESFDKDVLESSLPVLVDFTAVWCGPCQRLAPIIEDLAAEYAGRVKVGKVDIDQNQDLAISFGIQSVPTVIAFQGGKPVQSIVGLNTKSFYKDLLDSLLAGSR